MPVGPLAADGAVIDIVIAYTPAARVFAGETIPIPPSRQPQIAPPTRPANRTASTTLWKYAVIKQSPAR